MSVKSLTEALHTVEMMGLTEKLEQALYHGVPINLTLLQAQAEIIVDLDEKASRRMNEEDQTKTDNINIGRQTADQAQILESKIIELVEAGVKNLNALEKIIENADCKIGSSIMEEAVKYVRKLEEEIKILKSK